VVVVVVVVVVLVVVVVMVVVVVVVVAVVVVIVVLVVVPHGVLGAPLACPRFLPRLPAHAPSPGIPQRRARRRLACTRRRPLPRFVV